MPPNDDRVPAARLWHDRATGDLAAAKACLAAERVPPWVPGFHLQQAVEKSLEGT